MITRDAQFYRRALADLQGAKPTLAWITRYWAPDGSDPVRRAWDACCDPAALLDLLRALRQPVYVRLQDRYVDGQGVQTEVSVAERFAAVTRTPAGFEIDHLGLLTIVLPTVCDLIRFLHPAPNLDMFLDGTLSLGDA